MSRRQSVPSNIFYRKADPMPPLFPEPWQGDVYFNTTRGVLRIFDNGAWRDLSGGSGGSGSEEIWIGSTSPPSGMKLWIDTSDD